MTPFHITSELIARIDHFGASFNALRMKALASVPGNPFGVEVRHFGTGDGIACKVCHPLLLSKNRIYGFGLGDIDLLGNLLAFYRADSLPCTLFVSHQQMNIELFRCLVQAEMWSPGGSTVPIIVPDECAEESAPSPSPKIEVRLSGPEEKELYLELFQKAFADREESDPEYRTFQWMEDSLPGGVRYIAEIGGHPVGMASFPIVDRVGYFGTGGVLPEYRGRGVQMALIRQRIHDASSLGCDLILGGGNPGTTSYRNFERAGMRLVPTGSVWRGIEL